jgi:hypothetical protein
LKVLEKGYKLLNVNHKVFLYEKTDIKKRRGIMADKKVTGSKKDVAKSTAAATVAVAAKKADAPVVAKSEPAKDKVVEKNEPAKKPLGRRAKKAEAKAARKTAAKKGAERIQEVYFEFDGKQVEAGQVVKQIEDAYKNEGHQVGRIKDLKIYINSEDSKAYYVINGNPEENKFVEL